MVQVNLGVAFLLGIVSLRRTTFAFSPGKRIFVHCVTSSVDGVVGRQGRQFAAAGGGRGFGKQNPQSNGRNQKQVAKTYGSDATIKDVIDQEGAMKAFFTTREEWLPLFRKISGNGLPEDTAGLLNNLSSSSSSSSITTNEREEDELDFHENSFPWKRFEAIPQHEEDREFLAKFLDSMHQSLLDIPVTEVLHPETDAEDDEHDLHFVEEGRRMLAISRFRVLRENRGGSVESADELFTHVWSELLELSRNDVAHTGSLILLPNYDLSDLRRFADMNVVRPLQWLGMHRDFEVASLQRDSPAIRLLYKLSAMPSGETYTEQDGFGASAK